MQRGATWQLDQLLDVAECNAKLQIGKILATQTVPQTLESVGLCVDDRIMVEVTIDFFWTVAWPARVLSAQKVLWDAMPSIAPKYDIATEGNVRFVLTHKGLRLYDEDEKLYYKWHLSAPDGSAEYVVARAKSALQVPNNPTEGDDSLVK